jgi:hypothetical protein
MYKTLLIIETSPLLKCLDGSNESLVEGAILEIRNNAKNQTGKLFYKKQTWGNVKFELPVRKTGKG